jgi:hypothetical protein
MILWKKEFSDRAPREGVVFKRYECEWLLPPEVAALIKYNPRHLPVVIRRMDNEDYYLRDSIRRIIHGYRGFRTYFPPSPFKQE